MISRTDELPEFMTETPAWWRIKALYDTYGPTSGCDIFKQTENGAVTAVFGGAFGVFSLCAALDADFEELDAYFSFLGVSVFCGGLEADRLFPQKKRVSELLEYTERGICAEEIHCKISDLYGMLQYGRDGDIELPGFEYWYTDFCARYNHLSAEFAALEHSVAVCGFMTAGASFITGAAVPPEYRGRGCGRKAVGLLVHKIRQKYPGGRVFAAADKNAVGFYLKSGFKSAGKCALCLY